MAALRHGVLLPDERPHIIGPSKLTQERHERQEVVVGSFAEPRLDGYAVVEVVGERKRRVVHDRRLRGKRPVLGKTNVCVCVCRVGLCVRL